MRILFFLALLANLVFFLWQYNAGGFHQSGDEGEPIPASTKQIWLLSELEKKPPVTAPQNISTAIISQAEKNQSPPPVPPAIANTVAITTISPTTPAVKTRYCYRIKGFANKASATRWTQRHAIDTALLHIRESPPVVADYVVNYPAATSAALKKNSDLLKERGIKKFFMLNRKGLISLGVFKNEIRAIKAQQALIKKGINAKVSKRYQTAATVSAQIQTKQTRTQLLATLKKYTHHPSIELLSQCE